MFHFLKNVISVDEQIITIKSNIIKWLHHKEFFRIFSDLILGNTTQRIDTS